MPPRRIPGWVLYGIPILFCLAVHWLAIKTWFRADDFAWLSLASEIRRYHDWADVLFHPRAQGTIRVLSERLYFLTFMSVFGLNALPFRIWQFLTAFGGIALIVWITRRLTGSSVAALAAGMLWPANAGLAISLDWSSSYNEILCGFLFLLSFYCLLRYIDTGERRFWIGQWLSFLAGFGALELIVMYPAIAALYTWLCARRYFARTLWLFLPSALFTVFHFVYVPKTTDPAYAMHFGLPLLQNLWAYWAFAIAAARPEQLDWRPVWLGIALAGLAAAGAIALLLRRSRLALFFLAWFFLALLPVLPLTAHFSEYYVTIPAIGLAMLGGFALAEYPIAAAPLILLAAASSIMDIHIADRYFYEKARRIKKLVTGLEAERAHYAGKRVLISGVDNDLFWSGFADDPFSLIGIPQIYLAPGATKDIDPHTEWGGIGRFEMPLEAAIRAVAQREAVVYAVNQEGKIRDFSKGYLELAKAQYLTAHPDFIDAGDPLYAGRLGPGWFPPENGFRWMGKAAAVQIAGPTLPDRRLYVTGYCPAVVLARGPLTLTVVADQSRLGVVTLRDKDAPFAADFPLAVELTGRKTIEIHLEVNRTTQIGQDVRPLGLIFGTFRMK